MLRRTLRRVSVALIAAATLGAGPVAGASAAPPGQGPGGPILVVTNSGDRFGSYHAEILSAEGLNEFAVTDVSQLNAQTLANYDVVVLARTAVSQAQLTALTNWVQAGGNLVAMRPEPQLAGLLGLGSDSGDLSEGYMRVDTGTSPGRGITGATMQFHGTADRWTPAGASTVASLYADADTATADPAVTLHSYGAGQAAAFTYDLARSVVYTRQGNPDWAGDERDFELDTLSRPDDMFYGAKPGDEQPDWVNLDKVEIPQADEQQRLLANLITEMSRDRMPLPRFWYLPRGEKAAVIMTGDDHGANGTEGQFERFEAQDPPSCIVANWECIRATSYVYPNTPIAAADAGRPRGSRSRCTSAPAARTSRPRRCTRTGSRSSTQFHAALPRPRLAPHQPQPLHRLERLGKLGGGRGRVRRAARHELLLLARQVGPGPARHVHRLRLPAALRRRRRLADRRLPGDHAADRRVGDRLPRAHHDAAGQRAR